MRTVLLCLALVALVSGPVGAATPTPSPATRSQAMQPILELLEASRASGKGVTLYLAGQAIGGVVTKLGEHTVELKNREFGRIVVRLDRIDGAAMA